MVGMQLQESPKKSKLPGRFCDKCGSVYAVAAENAELWIGAPCRNNSPLHEVLFQKFQLERFFHASTVSDSPYHPEQNHK